MILRDRFHHTLKASSRREVEEVFVLDGAVKQPRKTFKVPAAPSAWSATAKLSCGGRLLSTFLLVLADIVSSKAADKWMEGGKGVESWRKRSGKSLSSLIQS